MSEYPEHEKLQAHRQESLIISEFLDFLQERGLHLSEYHTHDETCTVTKREMLCREITHEGQEFVEGRWHRKGEHTDKCYYESVSHTCGYGELFLNPASLTPEQIIGLFLDIDPKKLSAEKDAMYEELRANVQSA